MNYVGVIQSLSHVWFFVTPRTAARQVSLSFTVSQSLLKLMAIESVMPSNHLILCRPLLLLPSVFQSIRVFSNELALRIRWPKYWSFSISLSSEYSGLISFRMDWFALLAVQGEKHQRQRLKHQKHDKTSAFPRGPQEHREGKRKAVAGRSRKSIVKTHRMWREEPRWPFICKATAGRKWGALPFKSGYYSEASALLALLLFLHLSAVNFIWQSSEQDSVILLHSVHSSWAPTVRRLRHTLWGHRIKRSDACEPPVQVQENRRHQKSPTWLGGFYKRITCLEE